MMHLAPHLFDSSKRVHPRTIGWAGTSALAMGGSNQMIFLITALFIGQGNILGQGSAAVPLLILGVVLSWAAAPAWTELVLMWPNRVGGISAACSEAFRPYSPVLSALTGTCYWWGWVPTCGLTALLSAAAIQQWYLPDIPVELVAISLVLFFTVVNLAGVKWIVRLAIPIASCSATLAFLSSLIPILSGNVDWHQATTFKLTSPFPGGFGELTSAMAGLYLVGFAAPAFEAATCHVGETIDPNRNVPRAMLINAAMAGLYFVVLPIVWLGVLGPEALGKDLAVVLGPTFAPLFGSFGKAAAIWFIILNMFHGTMQPLAGAARTLSQLSEDGLLPRFLAWRSSTDCPWASTLLTAAMSTIFLLMGDPVWLIAAANFTYLIGICMPNIAAWLLRRDMPQAERPYRAPKGMIMAGVGAAVIWLISAILGFEQFGMPTVLFGLALAYSGAGLYAWRVAEDRHAAGLPLIARTLHTKLTGAMLLVLVLDAAGYLLAVDSVPDNHQALVVALEDIFVVVALLTLAVGLVMPGMITFSASEVSAAAKRLTSGTLLDFTNAMAALGRGDLDDAHAPVDIERVAVRSADELGELAESFNVMQAEVWNASLSLDEAREKMLASRTELQAHHAKINYLAHHDNLTGLPNRASLTERLAECYADAKARKTNFTVLAIDLDQFKEVNDVYGHVVGDELLMEVSKRLVDAAQSAFVARIGGDEFAIICSEGEQPQAAQELAARLRACVSTLFNIRGGEISIGLSVGGATYPDDGLNPAALQANADAAMYRAKADGRNFIRFFDREMDEHIRHNYALQQDLRSSIFHDQLRVHYQPLAMIDGTIFGFEALVRWQHPKLGMIPPGNFISLAEQNGFIVNIGEWVLREACREAASWAVPLQVSVNLSPIQFRSGDLASLVHEILLETGLKPARLKLEITEGVLINDPPRALSILRRLKSFGLKIALDDFGTGYASLSSLQSFPFDKIKVDRSFVMNVDTKPQSATIVRTIIGLGKALDIPVLAEGVETEAERAFLEREGCPEIQGYLIGRPHPIAQYGNVTSGAATQESIAVVA